MASRTYDYTAARSLDRAAVLIETSGWVRGCNATTRNRALPVPAESPKAKCFCAQGAVKRALFDMTGVRVGLASERADRTNRMFSQAMESIENIVGRAGVTFWNDQRAGSAVQVANTLRCAGAEIRKRAAWRRVWLRG